MIFSWSWYPCPKMHYNNGNDIYTCSQKLTQLLRYCNVGYWSVQKNPPLYGSFKIPVHLILNNLCLQDPFQNYPSSYNYASQVVSPFEYFLPKMFIHFMFSSTTLMEQYYSTRIWMILVWDGAWLFFVYPRKDLYEKFSLNLFKNKRVQVIDNSLQNKYFK